MGHAALSAPPIRVPVVMLDALAAAHALPTTVGQASDPARHGGPSPPMARGARWHSIISGPYGTLQFNPDRTSGGADGTCVPDVALRGGAWKESGSSEGWRPSSPPMWLGTPGSWGRTRRERISASPPISAKSSS